MHGAGPHRVERRALDHRVAGQNADRDRAELEETESGTGESGHG
jgi:hypothetical protein